MASRPNKYPDEVWVAIRTLWESVPKISWREVLEQVGAALQAEMPSEKVCRTRCEREGWKKIGLNKGLKPRSKDGLKDPKLDLNSTPENNDKSNDSEWSYEQYKKSVGEVEFDRSKNVDPTPIIQLSQKSIDQRAEVIRTHRDRCENLDVMLDQIMEACPTQHQVLNDPTKADELITMAAKRATVLEILTRSNLNVAKQAFLVWGISEEMFQDNKNAERIAQIQELEASLAVAADALEEQRQAMFERQNKIASGEFFEGTRLVEHHPMIEAQDESE